MTTYYRQCIFKSDNAVQTAWIEERGAKVGAKVTFKTTGEDPTVKWEVVEVGEARIPEKRAKEFERAYLHQRGVSDI